MTIWLTLAGVSPSAHALILLGGDDPLHNTGTPSGAFADSGWQYQVRSDFTATVVGPEHVLTASHMGIQTNSIVRFGGLVYRTVSVTGLPHTDLSLIRVAGRFRLWAPLYRNSDEVGKVATLFGRGLSRGAPVFRETDGTNQLRGWLWGANDFRDRWGTNVIEEALPPGGANDGALLASLFTADAGADEAMLAGGDSGGGLFLRDTDGLWKLAGVAFAVQAGFNTNTTGDGFLAALFDRRGFYERDEQSQWALDPTSERQPGTALYHTRVSEYADTLDSLMAQAAPATAATPRLHSSASPEGPFVEHDAYAVDSESREVTATVAGDRRFFRLDGVTSVRLLSADSNQVRLGF